jgi:hypothetical protein
LRARGFDAELLCVLGVQSLPAAELHGLGAGDLQWAGRREARSSTSRPRHAHRNEATVDVWPECEPSAAASQRSSSQAGANAVGKKQSSTVCATTVIQGQVALRSLFWPSPRMRVPHECGRIVWWCVAIRDWRWSGRAPACLRSVGK